MSIIFLNWIQTWIELNWIELKYTIKERGEIYISKSEYKNSIQTWNNKYI
jgi:hypothetical protein